MTKHKIVRRIVSFGCWLAIAGCTVQIEQTAAAPTSVPPTSTPTTAPTETATASPEAPQPTAPDGQDATAIPEPTATSIPTDWFGFEYLEDVEVGFEILPGWEELGLEGSVLFLAFSEAGQSVVVFNFDAGKFAPIFVTAENTWVLSASLRPDHSDVLLSYAPVPPEGQTQYGYTDLYRLTPGGTLTPLLERTEEVESFFAAFYSNSGSEIFFSWFVLDEAVDYGFRYHINRMDAVTQENSLIAEDGFWQALSADDARLAYVTLDPNAAIDDPAELRIIPSGGGGEPEIVLDPEAFPTIDAPFFSPDGRYMYFSAVSEEPPPLTWLDILTGVIPASAHNVPSDWWRADLETGAVEQVSHIFDQGMFGDFSPAGDRIAFISSTGLWVMNPDGSGLMHVIESGSFYGNLEWVK